MVILVTCYESDAFLQPITKSWVWLPWTWSGWVILALWGQESLWQ